MLSTYGTNIVAADSGRVVEQNIMVVMETVLKLTMEMALKLYAHCSQLVVNVGDTVNRANNAYVGSTGIHGSTFTL